MQCVPWCFCCTSIDAQKPTILIYFPLALICWTSFPLAASHFSSLIEVRRFYRGPYTELPSSASCRFALPSIADCTSHGLSKELRGSWKLSARAIPKKLTTSVLCCAPRHEVRLRSLEVVHYITLEKIDRKTNLMHQNYSIRRYVVARSTGHYITRHDSTAT